MIVKVFEETKETSMLNIGNYWLFNDEYGDYVIVNEVERKVRRLNKNEVLI